MIQPNELRIGNIVNPISRNSEIHLPIKNVFWKIQSISESSVWVYSIDLPNYEQVQLVESVRNISPVELTPDILEAAGFKYNQLTENYEVFYDCVGMLGINKYDGSFVIANDNEDMGFTGDLKSSCKYLHQLQNLIYCLTGEELQIDITKLNKEQ